MNFAQLLETQAKKLRTKPALIFKDQYIFFNKIKETSFSLANGLLKLGIKNGERITLYLPNGPEYIYSYMAAWCLGATAVPLDFMLTEDELVSCISHAEAKVLIVKPKPGIDLARIRKECPSLKEIIVLNDKIPPFLSFEELVEKNERTFTPREVPNKDYACIFYTSGTTGKPKGVASTSCVYRSIAPDRAVPTSVLGLPDVPTGSPVR